MPHHWMSGLPVFLAGGGARLRLIVESIDEADTRLRRATGAKSIDKRMLAVPGALTNGDVAGDMADRLSVAYGLSFDRLEIGEIITATRDRRRARHAQASTAGTDLEGSGVACAAYWRSGRNRGASLHAQIDSSTLPPDIALLHAGTCDVPWRALAFFTDQFRL